MSGTMIPPPGTPDYITQKAKGHQDQRPSGIAALAITTAASTTVLVARLYQSRRRNGRLDTSDWLITVAWLLAFYMVVAGFVSEWL